MMIAGFYEKEITPPIGGHMPGSFAARYSTGVKDERLMVKGAAFELNDQRVVILSADVLYLPQEAYEFAVKKINEYIGVAEENILIQATHSHTAGAIWDVQQGQVPKDDAYIEYLGHMLADCGILACHRMVPVTAKYAKTKLPGITFTRNYLMKDGSVRTNPQPQDPNVERPFGVADDEFQVMFFFDETNQPIASITNFSCHHCCAGGSEYCADYSGVLAHELKLRFGVDYINLMLSGTSGNLNHFDFYAKDRTRGNTRTPRYVQMGKVMAEAVEKLFSKAKPMELAHLSAAKEIVTVKKREIPQEVLEEAKRLYEEAPYDKSFDANTGLTGTENKGFKKATAYGLIKVSQMPDLLPVCVQAVKLGECMIYALTGEAYSEFGLSIKEKSPSKYAMVASIANGGTIGYIPTREAFGTNIYEAQYSSAKLEPEAGYKMVEKAIELAKKIEKN